MYLALPNIAGRRAAASFLTYARSQRSWTLCCLGDCRQNTGKDVSNRSGRGLRRGNRAARHLKRWCRTSRVVPTRRSLKPICHPHNIQHIRYGVLGTGSTSAPCTAPVYRPPCPLRHTIPRCPRHAAVTHCLPRLPLNITFALPAAFYLLRHASHHYRRQRRWLDMRQQPSSGLRQHHATCYAHCGDGTLSSGTRWRDKRYAARAFGPAGAAGRLLSSSVTRAVVAFCGSAGVCLRFMIVPS